MGTISRDFWLKVTVTNSAFAGSDSPDAWIKIPTHGLMLLNEDNTNVVEYSFNGQSVHGELNPTLPSRQKSFDYRIVTKIWFRLKSGSSGPAVVDIEAWQRC